MFTSFKRFWVKQGNKIYFVLTEFIIPLLLMVGIILLVFNSCSNKNMYNEEKRLRLIEEYNFKEQIEFIRDNRDEIKKELDVTLGNLEEVEMELEELKNEIGNKKLYRSNSYNFSADELRWLAVMCYKESGTDSILNRYCLETVLNRIDSVEFPNTLYAVLTALRQFDYNYTTLNVEVPTVVYENVENILMSPRELPSYVLYFFDSYVRNRGGWFARLNVYTEYKGMVFCYD